MDEALPVSRTVQFGNPNDPTADQRRRMEAGGRLFGLTQGVPGVGLMLAAGVFNAIFAWNIAPTVTEALFYVLIALFVTVAAGFLPLSAGMLLQKEMGKPKDDRSFVFTKIAFGLFVIFWALSIAAALAHLSFTYQTSDRPAAREPATVPAIDPRPMGRILAEIEEFKANRHVIRANGDYWKVTGDWLIDHTGGCKSFRFEDERVRCHYLAELYQEKDARALINGHRQPAPSDGPSLRDYIPAGTLSWFHVGAAGYFHLLAAALYPFLIAVAAGAIDVITTPPAPPAPPVIPETANGVDPAAKVDHFKEWDKDGRIEYDPTGPGVTPAEAWNSFQKWADANDYGGVPLPQKLFEQRFKGKYGKYWSRGTAGAIRYEKLKLNE